MAADKVLIVNCNINVACIDILNSTGDRQHMSGLRTYSLS